MTRPGRPVSDWSSIPAGSFSTTGKHPLPPLVALVAVDGGGSPSTPGKVLRFTVLRG
jgi:hypothetical protein